MQDFAPTSRAFSTDFFARLPRETRGPNTFYYQAFKHNHLPYFARIPGTHSAGTGVLFSHWLLALVNAARAFLGCSWWGKAFGYDGVAVIVWVLPRNLEALRNTRKLLARIGQPLAGTVDDSEATYN
ncbi:MAG: hypothetical protein ACRYFZ_04080 [Janthinobacterium lividum]